MAIKTFDHAVIYDGKFYAAGAEIKVAEPKTEPKAETAKVVKANDKSGNNKS